MIPCMNTSTRCSEVICVRLEISMNITVTKYLDYSMMMMMIFFWNGYYYYYYN